MGLGALVVVLLLFLAAVSGSIVIWGTLAPVFVPAATTEKLRPPQSVLSAILPFPAQTVHFTG